MKKVGALIPPLVKGLGLEEAMRFELIKRDWSSVFREPLSLHMAPALLKNGELLVAVDSPVWLQQVNLLKADILKKLGAFEVREVRFRIGTTSARKKEGPPSTPREKSPLGPDALREIEDEVSQLKDTGLRDSVRRAMEQSFRTSARSRTRRRGR